MKAKKIGSNQILKTVLMHDEMSEMFANECANRLLKFHTKTNGGPKIGSKKVGVQRFHNEQLAIARSVYYSFQSQPQKTQVTQANLQLF